jgi:hypothetical protein
VPPLVGVAVRVIDVPAQTLFAEGVMLTDGTTEVETLIVIAFEVTVLIVLQVRLDVTSQVITSLLAKVVDVNVLNPVPTFEPFFFH